jgi:hypothetical protein
MGFIQENRFNAPKPKVESTDYGAKYVRAATETPVSEIPAAKEDEVKVEAVPPAKYGDVEVKEIPSAVVPQPTEQEEAVLEPQPAEKTDAVEAEQKVEKRKVGRPKKNSKKK